MQSNKTNLDNILKNLKDLSFNDVEKYSQECSKEIIFDMLDKTKKAPIDTVYFVKCETILAEYRQRLTERVKKDSGIDIEHKVSSNQEAK